MMDPRRRTQVFEEMRSSDEAVNTAISAREQLITGSDWMLATEDGSDVGGQVLEFCEDNIYPVLEDLLRPLARALQYGFGLVEPVYAWADSPFARSIVSGAARRAPGQYGRKIMLRAVKDIRQTTVDNFIIGVGADDRGDLLAVRQSVWKMGGGFGYNDVPAEKLLCWVYRRQGDDYFGYPPTRNLYRIWTFKRQVENLSLLQFERFGVGTPIMTLGEGASGPEYDKASEIVRNWRAGLLAGIVAPYGSTATIATADAGAAAATLEFIRWAALAIAKTYLTQQTELGSTETGARAVGETFERSMRDATQDDVDALAAIINERLIVPLVIWNFGPQETYPAFAPSQRVKGSPALATVIQTLLAAGAVTWNAETDEPWLREKLEMPPLDLDWLAAEQERKQAVADAIAGGPQADPATPPTDGRPNDQAAPDQPGQAPPPRPRMAASRGTPGRDRRAPGAGRRPPRLTTYQGYPGAADARGVPTPALPGTSYRTPEYTAWEARIMRPDVLSRDLDVQQARAAGEVHDVLAAIDEYLAREVETLALGGAAALAGGSAAVKVPDALRAELRDMILAAAERVRDYGRKAVRTEVKRQGEPEAANAPTYPAGGFAGPGYSAQAPFLTRLRLRARRLLVRLALADEPKYPTNQDEARDLSLSAEVDRAVEDEVDRREGSARNALVAALSMAGALAVADLAATAAARVREALATLSPNRTAANVASTVNVAFGIGRRDGADELVTDGEADLVAKVYSAVMDYGTCDECARFDGAEYPIDYPEDMTGLQAPNPRCEGGYGRCRCAWIWISAAESRAQTPASRGLAPGAPYAPQPAGAR